MLGDFGLASWRSGRSRILGPLFLVVLWPFDELYTAAAVTTKSSSVRSLHMI